MTVAELIEKLKEMPQDAVVLDGNWDEVEVIWSDEHKAFAKGYAPSVIVK